MGFSSNCETLSRSRVNWARVLFYSKLPIASVSDNGCSKGGNHDGVRLLLRIVVVRLFVRWNEMKWRTEISSYNWDQILNPRSRSERSSLYLTTFSSINVWYTQYISPWVYQTIMFGVSHHHWLIPWQD